MIQPCLHFKRTTPLFFLYITTLVFFISLGSTVHSQHLDAPGSGNDQGDFGGGNVTDLHSSAFVQGHLFIISALDTSPLSTKDTEGSYSIDLTVRWNTSYPTKAFVSPFTTEWYPDKPHLMATDGQDLYVITQDYSRLFKYDLETKAWTPLHRIIKLRPNEWHSAAMDPITRTLYIPGGGDDGSMFTLEMMTKESKVGMEMVRPTGFYSVAWNDYHNELMVFSDGNLYSYQPSRKWTLVKTGGAPFGLRKGACFVPAYGGSKMILYGGFMNESATSDLYILDLESFTWFRGASVDDPSGARGNAACAVAGDYLVVYGGTSIPFASNFLTTALVYNLRTNQWVSEFIPQGEQSLPSASSTTSVMAPTPPIASNGSADSDTLGAHLPIILGVVLSCLVVMLIVLGYVIYRAHRQSKGHDGRSEGAAAALTSTRGASNGAASDSNSTIVTPANGGYDAPFAYVEVHDKSLLPQNHYQHFASQPQMQPPIPMQPMPMSMPNPAMAMSTGAFLEPHHPRSGPVAVPQEDAVLEHHRNSTISVNPSEESNEEGLQYLTIYSPRDMEYPTAVASESQTTTPFTTMDLGMHDSSNATTALPPPPAYPTTPYHDR
ncbi:hypothetical protein BGX34_004581 [Mortierella sp. NVP85]|nr:hypothetical protein BGX34_004581 [Mortierella sp. NVP85]